MTTACKTLAAYGYDAYQQLSIAEIQREMPRGIPTRDSRRADHLGRIRLRSLQQQQNASGTVRGALVQKLESKVTPPTTQPSMTMTRVGNGTVCSYTAVLRRQWHG